MAMNMWLYAAGGVLVALAICLVACFRGDLGDRIASVGMAGLLTTVALLLVVEGYGRPSFYDLPLTLAILSFGSGMAYVRFAQRWI